MNSTTPFVPGEQILASSAKHRCRVGLVASDSSGHVLGLTADHVLRTAGRSEIVRASNGVGLGRRRPTGSGVDYRYFFETIGVFAIEKAHVSLDTVPGRVVPLSVADHTRTLGRSVQKIGADQSVISGIVSGFGGSVEFVDPYQDTHAILHDVVEVQFENGAGNPLANGEAGSLVLTVDQSALGLLIAANELIGYVAPLAPFLRLHELTLFGGLATDRPLLGGDAQGLVAAMNETLWGLECMKDDLQSEMGPRSDPTADPIPHRLLDLVPSD